MDSNTPRVLARLTSEELDQVNGAGYCPPTKTVDLQGGEDSHFGTHNWTTGECD
jgi:hypothetical protein